MALSESSLNKTISTLEDTTSLGISSISLVKNQLGTVLNAGSKAFLEFCFDQEHNQIKKGKYQQLYGLWHRGVVVITTAQLHSTKPEFRFCAGSNPARGASEIRDGEDL